MTRPVAPGRELAGHAALVTGGAVRIGAAVALRLAAEGCAVAIHHNASRKEAERLADRLRQSGAKAATVQADLADAKARRRLLADAGKALGQRVDLLVNSASTFPPCTLPELTWDHLADSLAVNAWAPFELTMDLARSLPAGASGSVVNFLDARIVDEDRWHVGYHLAKRMLADFTRLCAVTLAPNVAVNAVAPGPTLAPPGTAPEEGARLMARLRRKLPLRRTPEPDDLADAVAYLLRARTVTGQVLFVDGGRHLGRQP